MIKNLLKVALHLCVVGGMINIHHVSGTEDNSTNQGAYNITRHYSTDIFTGYRPYETSFFSDMEMYVNECNEKIEKFKTEFNEVKKILSDIVKYYEDNLADYESYSSLSKTFDNPLPEFSVGFSIPDMTGKILHCDIKIGDKTKRLEIVSDTDLQDLMNNTSGILSKAIDEELTDSYKTSYKNKYLYLESINVKLKNFGESIKSCDNELIAFKKKEK